MRVLLVSTYELGHQPLHLASPAAALGRAGHQVECLDLSVQDWDEAAWDQADMVAFSVPMHTAMRLAIAPARSFRDSHPGVPICFYGLYAHLGADLVGAGVADQVISGEYEPALVQWVSTSSQGAGGRTRVTDPNRDEPSQAVRVELGRGTFLPPARHLLPPLDRYARLLASPRGGPGDTGPGFPGSSSKVDGSTEKLVGYTEASHGCSHRCKHCPVPVVYDGRIRLVGQDTVLADVAQLVEMGAEHITFGDPDFLNGPHHSLRVTAALHHAWPQLSFDITTKVEHVLEHAGIWPELGRHGCLFVVSALESTNDDILMNLDKGHTVAQAALAITTLKSHGIHTRPSFLPFTPWTTPEDIAHLLEWIAEHDLVGNVDPVQYSIRLLVPQGSLVLGAPDAQAWLGPYDEERLGYEWKALDPAADLLQAEVAARVEADQATGSSIPDTFISVVEAVEDAVGRALSPRVRSAAAQCRDIPRLSEPWFCCAEPTADQVTRMGQSSSTAV